MLLTLLNTRGIRTGKLVQNMFTSVKTLSLIAFILFGLTLGANRAAIQENLHYFWTIGEVNTVKPDLSFLPTLAAGAGIMGLLVAFGVSQVGSLFSSDAWNNITFTAAEVHQPERTVPKAMAAGTILVTVLYVLANVAYLMTIPIEKIKHAPDDRVATAALETVLGSTGAKVMAVAILISTFGCNNGLILAGARVYYAMAKDGLFFKSIGRLNLHGVPAMGLLQGVWAVLRCCRTRLRDAAGLPKVERDGRKCMEVCTMICWITSFRRSHLLCIDDSASFRVAEKRPRGATVQSARLSAGARLLYRGGDGYHGDPDFV